MEELWVVLIAPILPFFPLNSLNTELWISECSLFCTRYYSSFVACWHATFFRQMFHPASSMSAADSDSIASQSNQQKKRLAYFASRIPGFFVLSSYHHQTLNYFIKTRDVPIQGLEFLISLSLTTCISWNNFDNLIDLACFDLFFVGGKRSYTWNQFAGAQAHHQKNRTAFFDSAKVYSFSWVLIFMANLVKKPVPWNLLESNIPNFGRLCFFSPVTTNDIFLAHVINFCSPIRQMLTNRHPPLVNCSSSSGSKFFANARKKNMLQLPEHICGNTARLFTIPFGIHLGSILRKCKGNLNRIGWNCLHFFSYIATLRCPRHCSLPCATLREKTFFSTSVVPVGGKVLR